MKNFYQKYKHGIPAIAYLLFYLGWFFYIENKPEPKRQLIHVSLDDHIPFIEIFVIPYFLWFLYIAVTLIYFFLHDKNDFYRCCIYLFSGMTIFLIVSTLWPNGHNLRPATMARDNLFTDIVRFLYTIDTPTNLWPSIHVYNSIGCYLAVHYSKDFKNHKGIKAGALILTLSIIASTVFIKQHSVFDVITGILMGIIFELIVYRYDLIIQWKNSFSTRHNKSKLQM